MNINHGVYLKSNSEGAALSVIPATENLTIRIQRMQLIVHYFLN